MAVTLASLRTRFPEFANADDDLVQACIDEAVLMTDAAVYRAKVDIAVTYLAAHLIAVNPLGEMARLKPEASGDTIYSVAFERIKRSVAGGPWSL